MCSGLSRTVLNGTWCERQFPSAGLPSTTFGPVHPFGERKTIIGQIGRSHTPSTLARRWISAISSKQRSIVSAIFWCIVAGSSPSTKYGL